MNDRRPTELELAAGLRVYLPATAPAGLGDAIQGAVATVPQQRPLPWVLGPLTDADPAARQRALLLAVAIMAAVAFAGIVAVGALRHEERPTLPTGEMGRLAYVKDGDLYIADPNGSNAARVAHADGAALGRPLWAPDGSRVAMQAPEPAILVVDLGTGELRRLTGGTLGSWSPDSRELSYFTTNGDIAAIDVATGQSRTLLPNTSGESGGFASGWGDPLLWSPDGRWIVDDIGSGDPDQPTGLAVIDSVAGGARLLHKTELYHYNPDWSPDSSHVVLGLDDERRGSDTLWVADVDGGRTVEIRESGGSVIAPDWSPADDWIAYISRAREDRPVQLMLVHPDGVDAHPVADNVNRIVGWSPDGGSLAYLDEGDGERHELHVLTIADGIDRTVSVGNGSDFAFAPSATAEDGPSAPPSLPAIAEPSAEPPIEEPTAGSPVQPDGSWGGIAFRTQQGEFDCYVGVLRFPDQFSVIEPTRTGPPPEEPESGPAVGTPRPQPADSCELLFAPDGSAFARYPQLDANVDVVRMDGSVLAGPFPADSGPPRWSPGGGWLTVSHCDDAGGCVESIMRPDGSKRRDVPGAPHWSTGDRVMAVAGSDGSLLVGPGDGSSLRSIGNFPLPGGWSPDGSTFVFVRDGNAWLAQADGSGTRNLTEFELGGATQAFWSPDGRWIVVLQGQTAWVFAPDGSTRQRLGTNLGPGDGGWGPEWAPVWSPDETSVAFEHDKEVTLFRTDDWRAVRLTNAWQPAWSPDGQHLAVVSEDASGSYQVDAMNADGTGRVTVSDAISYPPIAWFK